MGIHTTTFERSQQSRFNCEPRARDQRSTAPYTDQQSVSSHAIESSERLTHFSLIPTCDSGKLPTLLQTRPSSENGFLPCLPARTASHTLTGEQTFGTADRGVDTLAMIAVVSASDSEFVYLGFRLNLRSTGSRFAGGHVLIGVDKSNCFKFFTKVCRQARKYSHLHIYFSKPYVVCCFSLKSRLMGLNIGPLRHHQRACRRILRRDI